MIPLLTVTDLVWTAVAVLTVVLVVGSIVFFLYDSIVTFVRGHI